MFYTTITNHGYYQTLLDDSEQGETNWTINKNAEPGDTILLYCCAPISAIVAVANISDIPYQDEDINSTWCGLWFAEMENLRMLDIKITRHQLRELFPDWGYWKQPRNSIAVPKQYSKELEGLLANRLTPSYAKNYSSTQEYMDRIRGRL